MLSAVDPASVWGAALPWPAGPGGAPRRAPGARVVLEGGRLLAWAGPAGDTLLLFPPPGEAAAFQDARVVARALVRAARRSGRRALLLVEVDGFPASAAPSAPAFEAEGFARTPQGLHRRQSPADD